MKKSGNIFFLIVFCLLPFAFSYSQSTQTIFYTTKDGLPSNSVYRTLLDKRGFLWIATENGLARYDGKNFKPYTTAQGLQDNEVTDIFLDSSGVLWGIPFGRYPVYYNLQNDRFENEQTDPELLKIELGNTSRGNSLLHGGVVFSNNKRNVFINKNGKTIEWKNFVNIRTRHALKVFDIDSSVFIIVTGDTLRYVKDGYVIKAKAIGGIEGAWAEYYNHCIYIADNKDITKITLDEKGYPLSVYKKTYPFNIRVFCFTGKNLAISSFNDNTYLLDPTTLEPKDIIISGIGVRGVLEDNNGNVWLSTKENGLVKIQQKRISTYNALPVLQQNFNAIIKTKNIIAGNNKGEVLNYDGLYGLNKITFNTGSESWVRKIIQLPGKIYVATQSGSYLLNASGNKIIKEFTAANQNKSSKAACIFNDSILILGTHALAYLYNINTFTAIDSILKRVVSLGKDNDGKIYIGSNEGLFRWDKDSLHNFGKVSKALAYKVNSICCTPENLLFVGIGSDSLVVMKEGKLIQSIPLGNSIPGSLCKSLFCNKAGEVWLGTNKGLNKINYTFANNQFTYSNTFFGLADGLAGDEVNDITVANDTVYAATNGGISFFPEKLKLPVADIATFITGISINGKAVSVQDEYSLSYDKNDITIEFSGVDLTGYSPFFEARINNGLWQRLDKNSIDLKKLAQGNSIIEIRAILRNGLPSPQTARVKIYIRTPFWQSSIFWSLLALAVFIAIIYLLQRRNREKQKQAIEKISTEKRFTELEMQALKAQINPHFVFNCLNSIKGFIYEKDYAQADKYLDKFSALMRSTVDNSDAAIISLMDEINYLDNYLQLEKLRFEDKFEYVINAAGVTDTKNVFVPAMLMQPYVENAIRHGVRFLENKKGKIAITATEEGGQLVCSIEDNGIGRQKATELKSRSHIEYQSRGMSISKRRAELYNITQEIIDKKDEAGNAAGTKIILRIPLELKQ